MGVSGKLALRRRLLVWYDAERRRLPWRSQPGEPADPYRVWVAEIMLQQTRVAVVEAYYLKFMRRFPDLKALAQASEQDVLAHWSGLGYYRRARSLRVAAMMVAVRHAGIFPPTLDEALALPGVGAYTAAAVLSIAYGAVLPAVDANLVRVASRLAGAAMTTPAVGKWLLPAMDPARPGDCNQALMDLGATICLPRSPLCRHCPLGSCCATRGELPRIFKPPRTQQVAEHYTLARRGSRVWLRQRANDATQLAAMWELPPTRAISAAPIAIIAHAITTRRIRAHIHRGGAGAAHPPGRWMDATQAAAAPLTGLTRKALRQLLGWSL